jgi:hypothetical protein
MQEQLFNSTELPDRITDHPRQVVAESECSRFSVGGLAGELIESCSGSQSLGSVYWFLRHAGLSESEARAEFELFLAGTLSERLRSTAARYIQPK